LLSSSPFDRLLYQAPLPSPKPLKTSPKSLNQTTKPSSNPHLYTYPPSISPILLIINLSIYKLQNPRFSRTCQEEEREHALGQDRAHHPHRISTLICLPTGSMKEIGPGSKFVP
jgi:hypothetical protein